MRPAGTPFKRADLGNEKISTLLARLSVPAMIGLMVNALYNFVDTIFVGHGVGPLGIAGLSIAFPIQIIIAAFALTFGTGSASIISRKLGEGDEHTAAKAAGNALGITVLLTLVILIAGQIFIDEILVLFGATGDILPYARDYVQVILFGSVFLAIAMCSNGILRAEGQAKAAMMVMMIGTGLNIILDPIFIFVLDMGIRGVAWATVISQFTACMVVVRFLAGGKSTLHLQRSSFIFSRSILRDMTLLGLPALVRQTGSSILMITINNLLRIYGGDLGIAAFGIINRLAMFVIMPLFGIVQGFQPIAGFNYGARKFDRVKEVLKTAALVTTLMGTGATILVQLFPRQIISIFTSDAQLLDIATPALQIVFIAVPVVGIQVVGATFFQAIGKSLPSLLLTLSRQIILLLPLALILSSLFQLNGLWLAFPAADGLSTVITLIWLAAEMRRLNRKMLVLSPEPVMVID